MVFPRDRRGGRHRNSRLAQPEISDRGAGQTERTRRCQASTHEKMTAASQPVLPGNVREITGWRSFFPPAQWLASYESKWLGADALAGFTLAAYAIPVSLAYAALAG